MIIFQEKEVNEREKSEDISEVQTCRTTPTLSALLKKLQPLGLKLNVAPATQ